MNHTSVKSGRFYKIKTLPLLILVISIQLTNNIPCNSFPKVFGANAGNSQLSQIDVYGEYLAMAGKTSDSSLTGYTSYLPYVAMMSVSGSGVFYWAKALSQKAAFTIAGIAFSTDGALIIAHSANGATGFITVFNAVSGAVMSARTYSTSSYDNYNQRVRSLVVGQGAAAKAFVLSNYQTSFSSISQNLIAFDPLTFSTTPIWAKKTLVSGLSDYGHLGLTFGRGEALLYAFSYYNSKATLSLLDVSGNSKWQYSTLYGDYFYNNMIQYKAVDSATDMVIATSGYDYINYNRIISSSTSPYSIQTGSQTYREPLSSISREIRALYIVSLTSARSLIYDIYNYWTDYATLDFSTSPAKITYKRSLPYMDNMSTGIFVSDTLYYVGSYGYKLYLGQSQATYQYTNANIWYQSIVYSSDPTQSTCYSISTAAALTPISMQTFSLTSIASTIYQASTVMFVADTAASTTVNIVQAMNTKLSWCAQNAFTVNSVTQATSTFNQIANLAVISLGITPYSATVNCGTLTNTWTYKGIDVSDGLPLDSVLDLIAVDPSLGTIQIQQAKPAGTYQIKVVGTLPDLLTTYSYVFTINLAIPAANQLPYFQTPLTDITVPLKTSVIYPFPSMIDGNSDTTSVQLVKDSATGTLPLFITMNVGGSGLTIYPTLITEVKAYTIIVEISDTKDTVSTQFLLTVTNQAPIVTTNIPSQLLLTFGQDLTYTLPTSQDPEGLSYTTSIQNGPLYVTQISNTQVRIFPSNCRTDLGNIDLHIKLEDQEPKSFIYSITLEVPNFPPQFTGSLPQNQTMMLNTILSYTLPSFSDPEGCPVAISYLPTTLSSFVNVQGNQIVFTPKQLYQVGDFDITVILTDYHELSTNATFGIKIYQPPKFIGSVTKQIELMASNEAYYSLPVMAGMPGEYVVHELVLPRFVVFNFPDYTFLPNRKSDLGVYTIKGQLWNAYTFIRFQFRLNVTNEAPYLTGAQLSDQIVVALNTIELYLLPSALDREGQPLTFLTFESKKSTLPAFVKFNQTSFEYTIAPTSLDIVGKYTIELNILDTMSAKSSYSFVISLYDPSLFLPNKQIKNTSTKSTAQIIETLPKVDLKKNEMQTCQVKMTIVKVSRDQEVTVRIQSSENLASGIFDIIYQITNSSMELTVIQKSNTYTIPYSIIYKDPTTYQVKIQLKYPNPYNLSISQTPDKLQILNLRRIQVLQKSKQIIMPENTLDQAEIPPQLTDSKYILFFIISPQDMERTVATLLQGGRVAFTQVTPVNIFLGFLVQILWGRLEDFSFLTISSMISITIPGIPQMIQSVILKLIYLDILYTELWMPQFMKKIGMDFDNVENDDALNIVFFDNGFQSKQFLKNAGSSSIFVIMYLIAWIILMIIYLLSRCWSKLIIVKEKLQGALMWDFSIKILLSQFSAVLLCSLINLYDMRFNGHDYASLVSAYFSVIILIALTAALSFLLVKIWKLTKNLNEETISLFKSQFSKITESLKETKGRRIIFFWKPLYLLRWLVTLIIVLALKSEPSCQIPLLLVLSVIQQCLILTAFPYDTIGANLISLYNEMATSAYLFLTFLLTDYLESQITASEQEIAKIRLQFAWAMAILLIATIVINFIFALFNISCSVFQRLRKQKFCNRATISAQSKYQLGDQEQGRYQLELQINRSTIHKGEGGIKIEQDILIEEFEVAQELNLKQVEKNQDKRAEPAKLIQAKKKRRMFEDNTYKRKFDNMFEMKK